MAARNISENDVDEALANRQKIEPARDHCTNIWGYTNDGRRIRVTIDPTGTKVVTAANAGSK